MAIERRRRDYVIAIFFPPRRRRRVRWAFISEKATLTETFCDLLAAELWMWNVRRRLSDSAEARKRFSTAAVFLSFFVLRAMMMCFWMLSQPALTQRCLRKLKSFFIFCCYFDFYDDVSFHRYTTISFSSRLWFTSIEFTWDKLCCEFSCSRHTQASPTINILYIKPTTHADDTSSFLLEYYWLWLEFPPFQLCENVCRATKREKKNNLNWMSSCMRITWKRWGPPRQSLSVRQHPFFMLMCEILFRWDYTFSRLSLSPLTCFCSIKHFTSFLLSSLSRP